jgi:hypothetical protein
MSARDYMIGYAGGFIITILNFVLSFTLAGLPATSAAPAACVQPLTVLLGCL